MLWSIVSNAAERSSNVRAIAFPESIEATMSFRSAVSVKYNLLKADLLTLENPSLLKPGPLVQLRSCYVIGKV